MRLAVGSVTVILIIWLAVLAAGGVRWAIPVALTPVETVTTPSYLVATVASGKDTGRGAVAELARFGVARLVFTAPVGRLTAAGAQWRLLAVAGLATTIAHVAIIESSRGRHRRPGRGRDRRPRPVSRLPAALPVQ
jgi:hypothetical protein